MREPRDACPDVRAHGRECKAKPRSDSSNLGVVWSALGVL